MLLARRRPIRAVRSLSTEARSLLAALLEPEPAARITAEQAEEHVWVRYTGDRFLDKTDTTSNSGLGCVVFTWAMVDVRHAECVCVH